MIKWNTLFKKRFTVRMCDLLAKTVQKGVYYLPNNEFYAFDILLNGHVYLDVDVCNRLFHEFGFVYAESLFRGNLQDYKFHFSWLCACPRLI